MEEEGKLLVGDRKAVERVEDVCNWGLVNTMQIVNGSVYTGASRSIDLWSVSEAIFLSEIMCVHVVCVCEEY